MEIPHQIRKFLRKLAGFPEIPKCPKCGRFMKTMPQIGEGPIIICRNPKCNASNQLRLIE